MDRLTKEQRSYNMSRVRSKNTKPEKLMFNILRKSGYKFKRHHLIAGKPDIAFPCYKIAVFIDGEFWHGKNFKLWKDKLSPFWLKKIGENIRRDRRTALRLRSEGWHIIHFWDKSVIRFPEQSGKRLIRYLEHEKKKDLD